MDDYNQNLEWCKRFHSQLQTVGFQQLGSSTVYQNRRKELLNILLPGTDLDTLAFVYVYVYGRCDLSLCERVHEFM